MTRPRRRYRWLRVYAVAVALSAISQTFLWPGLPGHTPMPGERTVEVPRQVAAGPVAGKPVTLSYRSYGDPESPNKLLLLHGSPAPMPNFTKLGPKLKGVHAIAVDMPGFGGSPGGVPDYGIGAQARYALAFMDAIGWTRAHVLGYSLGGGTALAMYAAAPRRVESIILYGGVGIMEGEGSGDYHFEQLKYRIGYAALVVGPELVPHFGLLGDRAVRHAFLRSFMDTDQRPLRGVLEAIDDAGLPLLIVHDDNDRLVPADTAREHHAIVRRSELVMLHYGHGGVFSDAGATDIAVHVNDFVARAAQPGFAPTRATTDPYRAMAEAIESPLPFDLDLRRDMGPWKQIGVIILGSYALEDPTTVFTGLMVSAGQVDPFVGLFGVFVGLFTGDLGVYLIGWVFGRRVLRWGPLARRLPVRHVERLGEWFDRHGWSAVLASRFIPGTRVPLYVSAGALGKKPGRMALWTAMAVAIWAVVMITLIWLLGSRATSPFRVLFGEGWLSLVAAFVAIFVAVRVLTLMTTTVGRGKLKAAAARLWWWEFWPMWVFNLPVWGYVGLLMVRYRGLAVTTAVNPCIPQSGYIDESKQDILDRLPAERVLAQRRVESAERVFDAMRDGGWSYPIVLKPDTGYRGRGLRLARDDDEVRDYFAADHEVSVAQVYHPGPHEAGVFYVRGPDEEVGRIFSITDKRLPRIEGDGKHTLEQLIYRHRRYRMQAGVFLKRFGDDRDRVLAAGESLQLVTAANHCQGAIFLDGARLITPELTAAFDAIAKRVDGFHFGRFDVRYEDERAFMAGRGFAIIELNGVTSESTNIYDPGFSLWRAWGTLLRQWELAFAIGAANARRGAATTPTRRLIRIALRHRRHRRTSKVSD